MKNNKTIGIYLKLHDHLHGKHDMMIMMITMKIQHIDFFIHRKPTYTTLLSNFINIWKILLKLLKYFR